MIFFQAGRLTKFSDTVKFRYKERLDSEQTDNSEPFPVTNLLHK